jgi:hypothetical protein
MNSVRISRHIERSIFFTLLTLAPIQLHANAGERGGNGGDICLRKFEVIRDDLKAWISKGGSRLLRLPEGLSVENYDSLMLEQIEKARVKCVGQGEDGFPVQVLGQPRTCKNFVGSSGVTQIVCDANKFNGTPEQEQYVLVHHEYAGAAGIEVNFGERSDFNKVSDQITGYLENQWVKRLVVRPVASAAPAQVFRPIGPIRMHVETCKGNQFSIYQIYDNGDPIDAFIQSKSLRSGESAVFPLSKAFRNVIQMSVHSRRNCETVLTFYNDKSEKLWSGKAKLSSSGNATVRFEVTTDGMDVPPRFERCFSFRDCCKD